MQNKQISLEIVKEDQKQKSTDHFREKIQHHNEYENDTRAARVYAYRFFKKIKLLEKQADIKAVEQLVRMIEVSPSRKFINLAIKVLGKNPTAVAAQALFKLFYETEDYSLQLHIAEALKGHSERQDVTLAIKDLIKMLPKNSLRKIFEDMLKQTRDLDLISKISQEDRLLELSHSYTEKNYDDYLKKFVTILEDISVQQASDPLQGDKRSRQRQTIKDIFKDKQNSENFQDNRELQEKITEIHQSLHNKKKTQEIYQSVAGNQDYQQQLALLEEEFKNELKTFKEEMKLDFKELKDKSAKDKAKSYIRDFTIEKNEFADEIEDKGLEDVDNELLLETFWDMLSERTTRYRIALSLGFSDLLNLGEGLAKSDWYSASKAITKKIFLPFHKAIKRKYLFQKDYPLFIMHNIYLKALRGKGNGYEKLVRIVKLKILGNSRSAAEFNNKKAKVQNILIDIEQILVDDLEKPRVISIQQKELIKRALELTRDLYNILDNFEYYDGWQEEIA